MSCGGSKDGNANAAAISDSVKTTNEAMQQRASSDPSAEPSAVKRIATVEENPYPGASYGDYATGSAWENVTQKALPDGTFETTKQAFYVESENLDFQSRVSGEPPYRVVGVTETVRHSDPDDVGGTEIDSDYEYVFSDDVWDNLKDAEDEARKSAMFDAGVDG